MAAGSDGEGACGAPMLAPALGFEAGGTKAIEGSLEVVDDHRQVATRRRHGCVLGHQVDLGATALEPRELGEGRRWLDLLEAEQLEELDGTLDVGRQHLYPNVMQHRLKVRRGDILTTRLGRICVSQNRRETSAAATTIAVDQVIASATILLSSP
ncbi:MAG: hypothetical protein QOE56_269 [Solirubrobacterales bacterium]|jgi:hypothetical protein|nr:hypothetical protein [Solirubrobacterales bacterium]